MKSQPSFIPTRSRALMDAVLGEELDDDDDADAF
jgi:hypothetical protein